MSNVTKKCKDCGKKFIDKSSNHSGIRCFECREKRDLKLQQDWRKRKKAKTRVCIMCGKIITDRGMIYCTKCRASAKLKEERAEKASERQKAKRLELSKRLKKCAVCGADFEDLSNANNSKYCTNCREEVYAKQRRECSKKYNGVRIYKKRQTKRKKSNAKSINEIARLAREAGMNYGEFVRITGI